MWKETNKYIETTEASDVTIVFEYTGKEKEIKQLNKSCGCTKMKWISPTELELTIETGMVIHNVHPKLIEEGRDYYNKLATVDVIYGNGTKEQLRVDIKVKQKFK